MTGNDYLKNVLAQQTFSNDDDEVRTLRETRHDVVEKLRSSFAASSPSMRWAGSMAKGTMIRESYDGDMTCYFSHEESEAGTTLEEIYESTVKALEESYYVERKGSAIRVKTKAPITDLHIDVVPGRFTDDAEADVFLHRTTGDKQRLKTNLQTHIDHIKDSGVTDAIRLMKLWKVRNGLTVKTFVLELLVVKLLKQKKNAAIAAQLEHIWTEMRDNAESLTVEDPANPTGNDLKPMMDEARSQLSMVAGNTLSSIETQGWEAVFGDLNDDHSDDVLEALTAVAVRTTNPTTPWLPGG